MDKLDKCYRLVQQSGTKGMRAVEIRDKLGVHRATVHRYLTSLELMGKVESKHGVWFATTEEQTIKPLEKEIIIELPIPKNKWQQIASLSVHAEYLEDLGLPKAAKLRRILLETFNETRIIRIKGKNIDDLDLEKLGNLIQQATENSSKFNFRGLFKGLKKSQPNSKK